MSEKEQEIACGVASSGVVSAQEDEEESVTLITEEGTETTITRREASMCELIKRMLDEDDGESIELANTRKEVLDRVLVWIRKVLSGHPEPVIHKPLRSNNLSDVTDEWHAEFVKALESEDMFELLLAANYLDVKSLLELVAAQIAT